MTTNHALDRINNRLKPFITKSMLDRAEKISGIVGSGKYYLELNKFETTIHLNCEGNINGDAIVAVINNNNIVTIMLAKSWKVKTYFTDGNYIPL